MAGGSGWGLSQWLLIVLAAVVLGAYLGALGPVVETLETKVDVVEGKVHQKVEKSQARVRAKLERLGNRPAAQNRFVDTQEAWTDALIVLTLFVFITPIAFMMAMILLVFLLSAIASALPVPSSIPQRAVVLVLAVGCAVLTWTIRDSWVPWAEYYASWVAKAYLVVTAG